MHFATAKFAFDRAVRPAEGTEPIRACWWFTDTGSEAMGVILLWLLGIPLPIILILILLWH